MSSGLTQRRRNVGQDTFNDDNVTSPSYQDSTSPTGDSSDNGNKADKYDSYDDDNDDGKDGKDRSNRLTILEEVLLLGLKDAQASLIFSIPF
jgi:hypothetical protein